MSIWKLAGAIDTAIYSGSAAESIGTQLDPSHNPKARAGEVIGFTHKQGELQLQRKGGKATMKDRLKNLVGSLWEVLRKDLIRPITAIVATILTIIGIVANDILFAALGILVVLDLLAISQLISGSATLSLEERSQDTEERVERIERVSIETRDLVRDLNIGILNAAKDAGITDIFTRRKQDERAIKAVKAELEKIRVSGGEVDLLGVALPDYFLRSPFKAAMSDFVQQASFRALILDRDSEAAEHRARIEYKTALTIHDIVQSEDAIRRFLEENRRVQGRLYSITPVLFLMLTKDLVFLEPYHLGEIEVSECIGGHVPFLKIAPVPDMPPHEIDTYTIMQRHFEELWRTSRKIEIGLSTRLWREHDRHWLRITRLRDEGRGVDLSNWSLKRDHAPASEIYSFPPGTRLEPGGGITISEGPGNDTEETKYTNNDLWEEGDNLVLRNAAGARARTFNIAYADEP